MHKLPESHQSDFAPTPWITSSDHYGMSVSTAQLRLLLKHAISGANSLYWLIVFISLCTLAAESNGLCAHDFR